MSVSVTLGLQVENYEPVPLRDFDQRVARGVDVESGFEISESPSTTLFARSKVSQEPAISVLQVTIRRPFTLKSTAAITWSLFPYVVPIFSVLSFVRHSVAAVTRGESVASGYSGFILFYLILAIFGVLLNEKVLKRIIQEPRPAGSASKSFGMPSGHSTNCYAWMVWCIVEIMAHPSSSGWFTIFLICLSLLVLGPVPYARVYLEDHTPKQVLVGMAVGSIIGLIAVPVRVALFPHATPLWLPRT